MSDWAQKNELWIIADEVYEHYVYTGAHSYSRPFAPECTISAYSFSKAFGMAGNRCGYLTGPEAAMNAIQRITRNSFYSVNTAAQIAAVTALDGTGDAWAASACERYEDLGNMAADRLGVPRPEGSTFLFVDASTSLDDGGLTGFLERCADEGLLVAPGTSFGPSPSPTGMLYQCASRGCQEWN